ncbi:MAG TPA: hypothetical protein DCE42_18135 [Myxococcales bacterium]|nr:hypothetical protein [Deltaproteobacteria bacterium]HAA56690.1 hypothetical protein [Myxococcales bacterium]|tara:strand:- start:420 stop:1169 length:750 start_codon:yes stop_codon:yes gene_type:complete
MLRSLSLLLLLSVLIFASCGKSNQVFFRIKGVALGNDGQPSSDGSFIVRDFRIDTTRVLIVVGDINLLAETPAQGVQVFSSLPPLQTPGEQTPAEQIGNNGEYPGLWAMNITFGAPEKQFAPGYMDAQSWKQIKLRFAPGTGSTIGLSSDELRGHTLYFQGNAQKGNTRCPIEVRLAFEGGIGQSVQFDMTEGTLYNNLIQVNYARWFQDVPLQNLCANPPVVINSSQNQSTGALIRDAFFQSFSFTFN